MAPKRRSRLPANPSPASSVKEEVVEEVNYEIKEEQSYEIKEEQKFFKDEESGPSPKMKKPKAEVTHSKKPKNLGRKKGESSNGEAIDKHVDYVGDKKEEEDFILNPLMQRWINDTEPPPGVGEFLWKNGLKLIGSSKAKELEEKWKKVMIAETEVFLRRLELLKAHTKIVLDALESAYSQDFGEVTDA